MSKLLVKKKSKCAPFKWAVGTLLYYYTYSDDITFYVPNRTSILFPIFLCLKEH